MPFLTLEDAEKQDAQVDFEPASDMYHFDVIDRRRQPSPNPFDEIPELVYKKHFLWTKGTLHAGVLDVHRVLFNLHRKNLPDQALKDKAAAYVKEWLIDDESSKRVLNCIFQERGTTTYLNDGVEEVPENTANGGSSSKLSPAALKELLAKRERMMQESKSGEGAITDQFRIYSHIIHCIETGQWLRLMVQVFLFIIVPARLGWTGGPSPGASNASN